MRLLSGRRNTSIVPVLLLLSISLVLLYKTARHFNGNDLTFDQKKNKVEKNGDFGVQGFEADELERRRKERRDILRRAEKMPRKHRAPDVIGIGARKCGTGAFKVFMSKHPLMRTAELEIHYYDQEIEKGVDYYISKLPDATDDELIMEKTPAYFTSPPADLPAIIKRDNPKVKIILMLCNPVHRAFSDFVMRVERSTTLGSMTFEEHIEKYLPPIRKQFQSLSMDDDEITVEKVLRGLVKNHQGRVYASGIYPYFLRRWLNTFPRDQITVIDGGEFVRDPGKVFEEVQEFLSLPKFIRKDDFVENPKTGMFCMRPWWDKRYNFEEEYEAKFGWGDALYCTQNDKGRTKSKNSKYSLHTNTAMILKIFYRSYNEMTFEMLGKRFNW